MGTHRERLIGELWQTWQVSRQLQARARLRKVQPRRRATQARARSTHAGSRSAAQATRPKRAATAAVVPLPTNGSATTSSGKLLQNQEGGHPSTIGRWPRCVDNRLRTQPSGPRPPPRPHNRKHALAGATHTLIRARQCLVPSATRHSPIESHNRASARMLFQQLGAIPSFERE
jgi:hypothetical protein